MLIKSQRSSRNKPIAPLPTPERVRIAQELHDGIAQDLVALGYRIDLLLSHEDLSTQARADIRSTRFGVSALIEKVREEILELRSGGDENVSQQISDLVNSFSTSNLQISLDIEELQTPVDLCRELVVITGEILRNCIAHSRATHIALSLHAIENHFHLGIRDDGVGGVEVKANHWGIIGIQERINRLGGTLILTSEIGRGTHFQITL